MVRIAEAECATCHVISPKTEMRQVRVRRRSTSSYRTYWGLRSGNRSIGTRDTYRHEQVFVCRGCKAPKSDGGFGFFFTAAIALAVIGWLAYPAIFSVNALQSTAPDSQVEQTPPTPEDPSIDEASAVEELANSEEALSPSITTPEISPAEPEPTSASASNANGFNAPEILSAEQAALNKSEAVRWKSNDQEGYSIASSPTKSGERECRNVYSTLDDDPFSRSDTKTFCRSGNEDWAQSL